MIVNSDLYIEMACNSHREMGQLVGGNQYLMKEYPEHIALVLCSGGAAGLKSSVMAGVISSMALTHTHYLPSLVDVGQKIVSSFARDNEQSNPAIVVVKITNRYEVSIIEYGSHSVVVMEGSSMKNVQSEMIEVREGVAFRYITFKASLEDRVLLFSNGVTKSGYGSAFIPNGWGVEGVINYSEGLIEKNSDVSAMSLSKSIADSAYENDFNNPKQDISCSAVYFRSPRRLLVCTGPPYNMQNDSVIAKIVEEYAGDVIISGGSTSQIVSRELGRELVLDMRKDLSGLPSTYKMDGVKFVTEGVLTLGKVKSVLENLKTSRAKGEGIDIIFVNELLEHDAIDFIVGTKINELHQNPNIPMELGLRRSVISDIARILETKYMKVVTKRYF